VLAIRRTWAFELEEGPHEVEVKHGHWSGYRTINVDGEQIHKSRNLFSSEHHFDVSGHPCILRVRLGVLSILFGIGFVLNFSADGKLI